MYLGGLRWAFYVSTPAGATTPNEVADCGFANYGLQSVFVTSQPMHIFVFETLTGNLLNQYAEPSGNAIINRGLETRLQSETGIFLAFQWFDGTTPKNWMIMEMNQSDGSTTWALSAGSEGADTAITDLTYTGSLGTSEYQRLYAAGYDYTATASVASDASQKDHWITAVDTTVDGSDVPDNFANSYAWRPADA